MDQNTEITDMSLADKIALGSGADFWTTRAAGSVPSLMLTDGPHGVRKQTGATDHLGLAGSAPATCFPPAVGLGQSWDPELVGRVGEALGVEARALDVDVLLGPGVNIKRDPRCGRNFEYLSEDPVVAGVLGAAWVSGLQRTGVGASLKHFALNNTEHDRMRSSSDVDARPLREIYLNAFSHIVRTANPWTVMCSYNKINGVYASENTWLLTDVLRGEWGFDGVVVSDWGAVADRPTSVAAGLDLEMPGRGGATDAQVESAVKSGAVPMAAVDRAAEAVARLAGRVRRNDGATAPDLDAHHALAREVAARSVVLLKNDRDVLPLRTDHRIAVIGEFAQEPRYQGGGSSHVNPTRLDVPLDEIRRHASSVTYHQGFTSTDTPPHADASLHADAVAAAADADVAVVFVGLGARQESEGFDREDIDIPDDQLDLITAIARTQPRTVVVLSHGGVLRLQPISTIVPAILDGALLGQAAGGALADVLFGVVNPSGRLTETVPERIQDVPAYLNFPGENSHVRYGEGIFVGYRWYDAREIEVTYPFGHGLSYTEFRYSDLDVSVTDSGATVSVTVTNSGSRSGRDVVQVYVGKPDSTLVRAPRELKGFAVTSELDAGADERVEVHLDRSALAYWETRTDRWAVEDGDYTVDVGASSRDIRASATVAISGDSVEIPLTMNSTLGEALADPRTAPALADMFPSAPSGSDDALGVDMVRMMASIPLNRLVGFGMAPEVLNGIVESDR
ncbi:glycosyl hydrolase [Rhodococcus sp. 06-418-1B]|nr:glycoside hydrolase family 3 C-terminal domain-containing protein [Rhodococcus sp. 06-418-1B]OZC85541.1 glycosyl hydrolase [Rhodococcus sp. 06-418-1B]